MPIPFWFRFAAIIIGLVLFAFQLTLAILGFRSAQSRDDRREATGAIIPGIAGLILIAGVLIPSRPACIVLMGLALPILVLGRAVYELVTFRKRGGAS